MALPSYDKSKRRKSFKTLPKGAYVITIKDAREDKNKSGTGTHLTIAFDIAEGEYKDFYSKQFQDNSNEDKKWPHDAIYRLNVPQDSSPTWAWSNWNSFFGDLEDSNNGFVFTGDLKTLKGKQIGGKFHIEQSEYNGTVYNHTRLRWTCIADDVRSGNYGNLPNDKLVTASNQTSDGFLQIPEGEEEELPF